MTRFASHEVASEKLTKLKSKSSAKMSENESVNFCFKIEQCSSKSRRNGVSFFQPLKKKLGQNLPSKNVGNSHKLFKEILIYC